MSCGKHFLNSKQYKLNKILIFRIGHLGDTLVALPAFWAVRRAFPNAHISLLSNADLKNPHYISPQSVLPQSGLFDDFITYPTNLGAVATNIGRVKLIFEIRRQKFDAVIYLMPRVRTRQQIERDIKFFKLCKIPKVLGANYLSDNTLTLETPRPTPRVISESQFLIDTLGHEGLNIDENAANIHDLGLSDEEYTAADSWFKTVIRPSDRVRPMIAIAPGSKWQSKIWPEDRYADVLSQLIKEHNVLPIIFGGPEDREKGDRLIAGWETGINSAGQLSVRQSAALLERCALYVGNDTGTMHLAAAVNVPCVAIFAAIDWIGRWEPFGAKNTVFRKTVECEGCQTADCFNAHKCLDLVSTSEVIDACTNILKI